MDRIEKEVSAGDVGMTRVLISGWFGRENLGDDAILECEIESIRSSIPRAEITVISQNPSRVREIHGVESIAFQHSPRRPLKYVSKVKELLSSDVFLLGGGGFLSDWQSPNVPEIWLRTPLQAKRLGSKTIAYGIGAGPITTAVGKRWTQKALNKFDAITVRDRTSKEILRDAGVTKNIVVTADPAILMSPPTEDLVTAVFSRESIPLSKDLIGLSLAPIFQSEAFWPDCAEKYIRYRKASIDIIRYIREELGIRVVLIPMDVSVDSRFLKGIQAECGNKSDVFLVSGEHRPQEILGLISQLRLLIGGRFHSIVFSALAGVPTIGISAHHKMRDFMEDVGLGAYSIPLGNGTLMDNVDLSLPRLKECVNRQLQNASKTRRKLMENTTRIKKRARRNGEILSSLVPTGES